MKLTGIILLIISTTATGCLLAERERRKLEICRELISFCDLLSLDVSFRKTPLTELINSVSYKYLDFLTLERIKKNKEIKSPLKKEENDETAAFLFSLGKSDSEGQLKLIEGFREYAKQMQINYSRSYSKNSKLFIVFGFFCGAVMSIMLI